MDMTERPTPETDALRAELAAMPKNRMFIAADEAPRIIFPRFEKIERERDALREQLAAAKAKWGKVAELMCGVWDFNLDAPEDYWNETVQALLQAYDKREEAEVKLADEQTAYKELSKLYQRQYDELGEAREQLAAAKAKLAELIEG